MQASGQTRCSGIIIANLHRALVVETPPARLQDRGGAMGGADGGQGVLEVPSQGIAGIHRSHCIDKCLQGSVWHRKIYKYY